MISVDEYLRTVYRPDRDYVDGEVLERNMGERGHSSAQAAILFLLMSNYPRLRRLILPEQRVQVKATGFRIPDICVLREDAPWEEVIHTPPALCIEVLSPDDSMSKLMVRINEYLRMGVPVCWYPRSGEPPRLDSDTRPSRRRAGWRAARRWN